MQKIKNFKTYSNENYKAKLDEGILSSIKKGVKMLIRPFSKIKSLVDSFLSSIKNSPIIPAGPTKGLPVFSYYESGTNGKTIVEQIRERYKGIPSVVQESEYSKYGYSYLLKEAAPADKDPGSFLKSDWQGVPNVDEKKLKSILRNKFEDLVEGGYVKPEFIYGAPGIGKTEIVGQLCDELGIVLLPIELRFSMPVDLIGVPKVATRPGADWDESGITLANPPGLWPRSNFSPKQLKEIELKREELITKGMSKIQEKLDESDGAGGIIFFDEFNRADEFVANALMQFVQTRKLAGTNYELPSKWLIVAAGNRPKDDPNFVKSVEALGSAMLDRFDFCNYVPTVEGFEKHINTYEKDVLPGKKLRDIVMPEMIAFLKNLPEYFYMEWSADNHEITTPRGWIDASKEIEREVSRTMKRTGNRSIDASDLGFILTRAVGKGASEAFIEFWMISQKFDPKKLGHVFDDPSLAYTESIRELFPGQKADPSGHGLQH